MPVEFTAHNIRLDDGTFTKPDAMEAYPWFISARRILETGSCVRTSSNTVRVAVSNVRSMVAASVR